jgi:hypothetical protein
MILLASLSAGAESYTPELLQGSLPHYRYCCFGVYYESILLKVLPFPCSLEPNLASDDKFKPENIARANGFILFIIQIPSDRRSAVRHDRIIAARTPSLNFVVSTSAHVPGANDAQLRFLKKLNVPLGKDS